jgi:hypothetical protein
MIPTRAGAVVAFAASVTFAAFPASAQDSVALRLSSGYPPPNRSSEFLQLKVSRVAAAVPGMDTKVDRYFTAVRKIIADAELPAKWGSVMVDGPYVEIIVVLDGAQYVVSTSFESGKVVLPIGASDSDNRIASAVEHLLEATMDQAGADLTHK